nr:hypothetical protein [Myxosarcina sp. GI1]
MTKPIKPLLKLAKQFHCFAVAIVLDLPESICHQRNRQRADRQFGSHVVRNQVSSLKRSLRNLKREGFRFIYTLASEAEIEALEVMSRFAVNPKWLIYLPPTMSPVATSKQLSLLELFIQLVMLVKNSVTVQKEKQAKNIYAVCNFRFENENPI